MGKALVVYNFEEAIKKLDLTSQKVDYPLSLRRSNLHNKRVVYPESVQQKAMARYRIAKTWLQQKNCSHMKEIGENLHAFVDAYNMGAILKNEYQFAGKISRATLYRWIKDLNQNNDNWECLVDNRWKKDYQINLTVAEQAAFLRCYCNPAKLTIKMAVQAAKWLLHEHGIPSTAIPKTFSRFLEKFKKRHNHIIVYAREGKKACLDKCLPYITRDVNQLKVGDVLVADGHKLNFFIQHPQTKRPVRMILIVFFDWRSRYPMGWQIVPTENVVGIQAAFFNACVYLGKYPTVVYIDNGRAFKAKVFTETNPNLEHLSGLYVRLNVQFICARAYMGRSKLVERMFRTMNDQCVRVLPSFCGANIADKPAWMHRDEKFHKKMHAIASGNYVPTMFEASSYIGTYFDWYVNQPHEGLDGDTPNHIAVPGLGPGIDPSEISYEFLWRKEVTPRRCEFDFYRMKYTCDELLGYTGKAVAMYDNADISKIYMYSDDVQPEYLGIATPKEAIHPMARILGDKTDVESLKQTLKDHARAKKQTEQAVAEISGYKGTQEVQDALKAIPWNEKTTVEVVKGASKNHKIAPQKPLIEISDEQIATDISEIETNRPFFLTSQDRYDWLLSFESEGGKLKSQEKAFMADFENQLNAELSGFVDEYKEAVGF
jgi:putative transposase